MSSFFGDLGGLLSDDADDQAQPYFRNGSSSLFYRDMAQRFGVNPWPLASEFRALDALPGVLYPGTSPLATADAVDTNMPLGTSLGGAPASRFADGVGSPDRLAALKALFDIMAAQGGVDVEPARSAPSGQGAMRRIGPFNTSLDQLRSALELVPAAAATRPLKMGHSNADRIISSPSIDTDVAQDTAYPKKLPPLGTGPNFAGGNTGQSAGATRARQGDENSQSAPGTFGTIKDAAKEAALHDLFIETGVRENREQGLAAEQEQRLKDIQKIDRNARLVPQVRLYAAGFNGYMVADYLISGAGVAYVLVTEVKSGNGVLSPSQVPVLAEMIKSGKVWIGSADAAEKLGLKPNVPFSQQGKFPMVSVVGGDQIAIDRQFRNSGVEAVPPGTGRAGRIGGFIRGLFAN